MADTLAPTLPTQEGYANVREYLFAQSLQGVMYILGRCSTRPSWRGQQQSNKYVCFYFCGKRQN